MTSFGRNVMLPVGPVWVSLIEQGKKRLIASKTIPQEETPFTVYLYESHKGKGRGLVVGQFRCLKIERLRIPYPMFRDMIPERILRDSCQSYEQLSKYGGYTEPTFFWHIAKAQMYDEPLELSNFVGEDGQPILKAPMGWRYVWKKEARA